MVDKRDKRIDLIYAYADALSKNAKLRETHPNSKGYIWRTQRDDRVRALHEILEGEYCEWDDPPIIGIDTGGITIHGHPGEAWNCRCWAQIIEEPIQAVKSQEQPAQNMPVEEKEIYTSLTKTPITKTKKYKEQIDKYVRMIMKVLKTSKTKIANIPKSIYSSIVWSKRR